MKTTFIHTADWQIGKPFASIPDPEKRTPARQERLAALDRIAQTARDRRASFILVAGDLFDSPHPTNSDVAIFCAKVGGMAIPVLAIPGNHDHGGPGGLWDQPFFRARAAELCPNLRVLLDPQPVELDAAVIFPCPLLRRHEAADTTAWLRDPATISAPADGKPRIVLAHGSIQGFGSQSDNDDTDGGEANRIDLDRLPAGAFDYIALGDWHGTKQVGPNAWYSGTPEADRFARGADYASGNILAVTASRSQTPAVETIPTGSALWHQLAFTFAGDDSLDILRQQVDMLLGNRAGTDHLLLELGGSLGIAASTRLQACLEAWDARLVRLKLRDQTRIAPNDDEIDALTRRPDDPLIAAVARQLLEDSQSPGPDADIARLALRELHAACTA